MKKKPIQKKLTDQELTELIQDVSAITEKGGMAVAQEQCARLKAAGIKAGMKMGKLAGKSRRNQLEWYAGQFVSMVEEEAWFGINSWINTTEKFTGPLVPPKAKTG